MTEMELDLLQQTPGRKFVTYVGNRTGKSSPNFEYGGLYEVLSVVGVRLRIVSELGVDDYWQAGAFEPIGKVLKVKYL